MKNEFHIRECGGCRHRFAEWSPGKDHVSAVYGDSYFFGGGAGYPDYLSEEKLLREHGIRYARRIGRYLRQHSIQPGSVLDVGAAAGFLCDGFRSEGWRCEALEPNQNMAKHGRDRRSLETLAGQFGFDPVASGRPVKRIIWRHARSLLDEKIPWRWFHYVSGLIPDQTVPPYPSGDLFLDAAAEASGTERAERAAMDKLCTSTKFEDTCPDS